MLCISPVLLKGQVYINEVMASNATDHPDPDFGEYSDWIELHNAGEQAVDLSGYYLSDDPANGTMWTFQSATVIEAGGFLLIYADGRGDGLHSNFELAREGELVLLLDPGVNLVDSLRYPELLVDISYGRSPTAKDSLGFFDQPSAGEANPDSLQEGISRDPIFTLAAGFHNGPQTLGLIPDNDNCVLRYSLDGSEPGEASAIFSEPIAFDSTIVLRVRSYEPGHIPGQVITRTFFVDQPQNLPVFSLVTDPEGFFSDDSGIYVVGTSGLPGYCTEVPHNVNMDWERAVNLELFELGGSPAFNQQAGAKIFGGCSRTRYPIKSLAFYARKIYGETAFDYRIFPDKEALSYENFILRAAADDQPMSLFRDGMSAMLVKDVMDVDVQGYRPAVLYINGQYWGIHNMREKISEHYPAANFGVNPDSVDLIASNPELEWNVLHGSADHYNAMIDYLEQNDITQDEHYQYIRTQMDVDEYINYQIVQLFLKGNDWPGNNIKYWRSREEPFNRWRWVLYDLDHLFKEPFYNLMEVATDPDCGCSWPNPPWSTYLFRRLIENESFNQDLSQRMALYANTHFSRERIHTFIDSFQNRIAPEIPRHIERWGGQRHDLPDNQWVRPIFTSVEQWEGYVDEMRVFTDVRQEHALKHVGDYLGKSGYSSMGLRVEPSSGGCIELAGVKTERTNGRADLFRGEQISLIAMPEAGYIFSHWERQLLEGRDTSLVGQGEPWNYLVSRSTPQDWTLPTYDDQAWPSGFAELGYGDGGESTVLGYGGDPNNKNITTWFRKTFTIKEPEEFVRYTIRLLRDDGARVYLNGTEVIRDNMQRWSLGSGSTALRTITGTEEGIWVEYGVSPALFVPGENVLAAEIHQVNASSSDISFDLELIARSLEPGHSDQLQSPELDFVLQDEVELTAVMVPDTFEVSDVFINELVADNDRGLVDEAGEYEDWLELFNAGSDAVDLAGLYLSDTFPAPNAWQIPLEQPDLTTLEPGAFMVVIADNEPLEGPLHATFQLDREGETIYLLQRKGQDTLVVDRLGFGVQGRNVSYGRFPDGAARLEYLDRPTPGEANYLEDTQAESLRPEQEIRVYPVPSTGRIYIRSTVPEHPNTENIRIRIFSLAGTLVLDHTAPDSELIELSLEHLEAGVYFLRLETGKRIHVKQILLQ